MIRTTLALLAPLTLCGSFAGCGLLDSSRTIQTLEEYGREFAAEIGSIRDDLDAVKDIASDASLTPEERERMIAELEAKIDESTDALGGRTGELFRDVADRLDNQESTLREITEGAGDVATGVAGGNWLKVIGGVTAILGALFFTSKKTKQQVHAERDMHRETWGAPPVKGRARDVEEAPLTEVARTVRAQRSHVHGAFAFPSSDYQPPEGSHA